jgi:hypothetical protein
MISYTEMAFILMSFTLASTRGFQSAYINSGARSTTQPLFGNKPIDAPDESDTSPQVSRREWFRRSLTAIGAGTTFVALTVHALENSTIVTNPALRINNATKQPTKPKQLAPVNVTNVAAEKAKAVRPRQPNQRSKQLTKPKQLAPVNLTNIAAENQINVTLMCPPTILSQDAGCITVDKKTLNKVITTDVPKWVPERWRPKPRVIEVPNWELLESSIVAGSAVEMFRTSLLYPLKTVKSRIQAVEGTRRGYRRRVGINRKKRLKIKRRLRVLGLTFQRQAREGKLYAGIVPSLLVSVPCTGVYYGVRDITKRMLRMSLKTPTKLDDIAVSIVGALVADVVTLIVRTPADVLAIRLQVGSIGSSEDDTDESEIAGDWFSDSIERLPAAILTDLPYLLTRITLNGLLAHGNEGIGRYELIYIVTACACAILTTPFDVARTRILIDSNDDPTDGIDGGSGEGLVRTMKTVADESDGGVRNLFRGWFERVTYLGIGRAWLDPLNVIGYIGIRDAVLLEWFD